MGLTQAVVIKSKSYGIHLVLNPDVTFQELLEAVIEKFADSGAFLKMQMSESRLKAMN